MHTSWSSCWATHDQDKIDKFFVGGPPCAACTEDSDCDPFGLGDFYCEPGSPPGCPSTGGQCVNDFPQCPVEEP